MKSRSAPRPKPSTPATSPVTLRAAAPQAAGPIPHGVAVGLAVAITAVGGLLYGNYSRRWGPPPDLVSAGARLAEMPKKIGTWSRTEESTMSQTAIDMLECAGYVNCRYVDQGTGQTISLAILVGPPGPISVHTPEVCFSSRAYDKQGTRQATQIKTTKDRAPDTFWTIDFTTRNPLAEGLRVYYAWSPGGAWRAADSPRFEFARAPFLYKLQLASPLPPGNAKGEPDAGHRFLEALGQSGWKP